MHDLLALEDDGRDPGIAVGRERLFAWIGWGMRQGSRASDSTPFAQIGAAVVASQFVAPAVLSGYAGGSAGSLATERRLGKERNTDFRHEGKGAACGI